MDDFCQIFESLVKKHGQRLFWHVRGIVGSHDAAADVVQETYLKAWKALPSFRSDADMFTWLWRIATNEALNFVRRERLRSFLSLDAVFAGSGSSHATNSSARSAAGYATGYGANLASDPADDPYFNGTQAQLKLERALRRLPPKQRSVFVMRYYEELPYEKIAQITGTSEGALKASYHLAQEKIKLYIEQDV